MEQNRTTKVIAVVALLLAVIGVSVGFAAMATTLNINGSAEVNPASWSVKFANLNILTPSGTNTASMITIPTINTNSTVLSTFGVSLKKPGDFITMTFDIQNTGTMNAQLGTFVMPTPVCSGTAVNPTDADNDETLVCSKLIYTLKYTEAPGNSVATGDTLPAAPTTGSTKQVVLRIEFDATAEELPTDKVEISNLSIALPYAQV